MKMKLIKLSLVAAAVLSATSVYAESAKDNEAEMEEIVITGVRGSILNSINQKRGAEGFVDAISAEDVGKFPDLNISESLQRIPGVTLTRNDFGDGSAINLRGLGPNFSRVEINGMTAPVNDARGGGFNFEILASELFSNAVVKKSFNASDVEGGLAGMITLDTPDAFANEGFNLTTSLQGQTADNADDFGPRAAVLISHNVDNIFGVTASFAYSDVSYLTPSNGGISSRPVRASDDLQQTATAAELAAVVPSTINYEINNDERQTLGATLGLQYRPSDDLEIKFDALLGNIEGERRFTRADAPPEGTISSIENAVIENGVMRSGTLCCVQNRIATNDNDISEDFSQITLKADYRPNDNWLISPFVGVTSRELSNDASLLSFARGDADSSNWQRYPVSFNVNGQFIEFSSPGMNLDDPAVAQQYYLNVFLIRPTFDKDEEVATKIDFSRFFDDGALSRINFGARYNSRETTRRFTEVRIDNAEADTDLRTLPTLADALVWEEFDIDGMPSSFPSRIVSADPDAILDMYFLNGFDISAYDRPNTGEVSDQFIRGLTVPGSVLRFRPGRGAQESFSAEENTFAVYAEATFELDNISFNAGLRYIDSEVTSSGYQVVNSFSTAIEEKSDYNELLPSMSLRYEVNDDVVVRSAYSKSLTRPTLNDIRVSESFGGIDESGGTGSKGNPALKPFTSDNLDLGVEWYFDEEALLALNGFYKKVDGLIVSSSTVEDREFPSQVTGDLVTGPITFTLPINGEEAEINGLEFIVQSRFDFLSPALSDFGGIFNYTYTDSDAAFEEGDENTEVASIPGLSPTSYNAIIYYDDGAVDARLSYAYRERFVVTTAGSFGVPVFQNDYAQLDFSVNYNVSENLTLQFQALNLTKERLETESVRGNPHDTAQLDRRYFFGMRYSL